MDNSGVVNGDDHGGIPDDLRCKRSDGKQWRCTALSMPDKTVCEKHYIQAKKRAANSALRASMKKTKRRPEGESPVYMDGKSDDHKDLGLMDVNETEFTAKKDMDRVPKNQLVGSPGSSPQLKNLLERHPLNELNLEDDMQDDSGNLDGSHRSFRTSPSYAVESLRDLPRKSTVNGAPATSEDVSDASTDSSRDTGGLTCHQCQRSNKGSVIWCLKCERRGYCSSCISTWYANIPLEEIQRLCPACRGSCSCKVCSRVDNLIKGRIKEIPALDKLRYLYCLLFSVLPIVKRIHQQQCVEIELEKKLRGVEVDLERTKLNADEQMCCDCCRVPIVDYHRHCPDCSYDLCLNCCQDLRVTTRVDAEDGLGNNFITKKEQCIYAPSEQESLPKHRLLLTSKFPGWRANEDGGVPCLPRDHGGCGSPYLTLQRIFKMNWVAKLVKNLEEMVSGCTVDNSSTSSEFNCALLECAHREESDDNFIYGPSAQELKRDGTEYFRKNWAKGKPVIVKEVCDISSSASWDPMVIWREICEATDERMNDASKIVKAVDCLDLSEVDIELGQFMKGYSEGLLHENDWPQMLKLKDWPSPSASEEFFLYQRPEFISKVPLLEFIHSKFGLLNVAAKLPHYSLQNDVGPKIFISYGLFEELGRGDSVTNLHLKMRDMVYILVHSCEVKVKGSQQENIEKAQKAYTESGLQHSSEVPCRDLNEVAPVGFPSDEADRHQVCRANLDINLSDPMDETESQSIDLERESVERGAISSYTRPGAAWDVFRREDISKLTEYLKAHWKELGMSDIAQSDSGNPIFNEQVYLKNHHKTRLKEEFGVEPWSFEQYLGQAVFIPAGCLFQVRYLQSTVQLGLDFLSPESLEQASKLAEEIRILPNDHATKLQMVEVGKISLYAASSAIKDVQKLVLDQKSGAELVFEDRNLTAMVSENLEKLIKQRQIA
ncbi:E3 ubiquitin-protein ligase JMJ24 isoform X2 [Silene latifolia]